MEETIQYVALGDSLSVGVGAPFGNGFADYYRTLAEERLGRSVILTNRGVNGAKVREICDCMKTDTSIQSDIREASLITITAGGNDMLQAANNFFDKGDKRLLKRTIKSCKATYKEMIQLIRKYKQGISEPYLIRIVNLYNPIPEFSETIFWVQLYNKMLGKFEDSTLSVADIYSAFLNQEEHVLYNDRVHPNAEGYRLMAERVAACGFGEIPVLDSLN